MISDLIIKKMETLTQDMNMMKPKIKALETENIFKDQKLWKSWLIGLVKKEDVGMS